MISIDEWISNSVMLYFHTFTEGSMGTIYREVYNIRYSIIMIN